MVRSEPFKSDVFRWKVFQVVICFVACGGLTYNWGLDVFRSEPFTSVLSVGGSSSCSVT